MQDVFDFDLIRGLLSRSDFGYVLTSIANRLEVVNVLFLGVDVSIIGAFSCSVLQRARSETRL